MKQACRIVMIALCVSALAQTSSSSKQVAWLLRFDGIGPVRVGMTLPQVNAALGEQFSSPSDEEEKACFYLQPTKHPDTAIMMLNGRVARIDVSQSEGATIRTATVKGIRIGDSASRVKKAYGKDVVVSPHAYTDGHYITILAGAYGLRFETDANKVTSFYAGSRQAISFIEGCA